VVHSKCVGTVFFVSWRTGCFTELGTTIILPSFFCF